MHSVYLCGSRIGRGLRPDDVSHETRSKLVNRLPDMIEWLTDNGSSYIEETRCFAHHWRRIFDETESSQPNGRGIRAGHRTRLRETLQVPVVP